jgi:hypothetical protein
VFGKPVDTRGEVVDTIDLDGKPAHALELIDKLADSAQVRTCVANQMTDYLTGRRDAGACARQQVQSAFAASNHSVRDLIVEILAGEALTGVR